MLQPRLTTLLSTTTKFTHPSTLLKALPTQFQFQLQSQIRIQFHPKTQTRQASHATQSRANKAAQGPGKRLGAKRGASELVVPGCILFRQRGALWWPGENCVMGRDHTISALAKGYVRYYRDPERHPKRKFIGVVFGQDEILPRGRNMSRRRRLGMVPRARAVVESEDQMEGEGGGGNVVVVRPVFTDGYQYRLSNTEIGRAAKESGIVYPVYRRGQRWLAWRLRAARKERAVERLALRKRTGGNMGKKDKAKKKMLKKKSTKAPVKN